MKQLGKYLSFFICSIVLLILIIYFIGYIAVYPGVFIEGVQVLERWTDSILSCTAYPLNITFWWLALVSFTLAFLVQEFFWWPILYFCIICGLFFIGFSVWTQILFSLGVLLLYVLLGITLLFYFNWLRFLKREWGVSVERWQIIEFGRFKGVTCFSTLFFLYHLRYSILQEFQIVVAFLVLLGVGFTFCFWVKSFRIVGSIKCHQNPKTILSFNKKELVAIIPFVVICLLQQVLNIPLLVVTSIGIVSFLPLFFYFVITNTFYPYNLYIFVITFIRVKYTSVYILTLVALGIFPLVYTEYSLFFPSMFIGLNRFFRLMLLYHPITYMILRDLLCCQAGPAHQTVQTVARYAFYMYTLDKVTPHVRSFIERESERHARNADLDFSLTRIKKQFDDGGITDIQRKDLTSKALLNNINTEISTTTKVKKGGFTSVTDVTKK